MTVEPHIRVVASTAPAVRDGLTVFVGLIGINGASRGGCLELLRDAYAITRDLESSQQFVDETIRIPQRFLPSSEGQVDDSIKLDVVDRSIRSYLILLETIHLMPRGPRRLFPWKSRKARKKRLLP